MANITVTSTASAVSFNIDGKESSYARTGELRCITDDRTGDIVGVLDQLAILKPFGQRINIDVSLDTIDVDGTTSFADAGALIDALTIAFFT
jgi:hypothetical protein